MADYYVAQAVDCRQVVNPARVEGQVKSGTALRLSAAPEGSFGFDNGARWRLAGSSNCP